MRSDPKVTAIVVTYNSAGEIAACLRSVVEHVGVSHEIILVDNASADATLARVRGAFAGVRIIPNTENLGFSRANNQALEVARGQYVLFLNPDTELKPEALPRMLVVLEGDPGCAGVGPRLVNPDGRVWRVSARRLPTLWTEFCQWTALDRIIRTSPLFAHKWYEPWDRRDDRDVECLTGAALLCRTQDIRRLGGFDESVPLYLDDMDLCRRLGGVGRLRYCSGAVVLHHHDVSAAQQPQRLIVRLSLQALYRYFDKHRGRLYSSAFVGIVLVLGLAAGVLSLTLRVVGQRAKARREADRARTFLGWSLRSKAGPWSLPQAPSPAERRLGHGLFPNLG